MNQYIQGMFGGMLILCIFMMVFPKAKTCVVEIGRGNVTHVTVGKYSD